jgi:hypothetical protein
MRAATTSGCSAKSCHAFVPSSTVWGAASAPAWAATCTVTDMAVLHSGPDDPYGWAVLLALTLGPAQDQESRWPHGEP